MKTNCKKKQFKDHDQAVRAIHLITSKGEVRKYNPVRAYLCDDCGYYHLTHHEIDGYLAHKGESFTLKHKAEWSRLLQTG